jgi:GyrI-like small molecule binding domain
MTTPQIDVRPAQPYLGTRGPVINGVRAFVDKAFPELFGALAEQGIEPAGPPFLRYHVLDGTGEPLELEAGVPVNADVGPATELPAGRYLTLVHVGPYTSETLPDLAAARERLTSWAETHGLSYARKTDAGIELPCALEQFLVGPVEEPDFTKWRTEFAYLLL